MQSLLASLDSVGVFRSGRWLVHDVTLQVRKGEIVSLIGPNGSGKTTITKFLSGSLTPDRGVVRISAGIKIGYVPQRSNIDSTLPMTVRRLMNLTGSNERHAINEALDEMNILKLADSPVQNLSGGEFQRALLARALLKNPDFLILDEPAQGLDVHGEARLYEQIVDIRNRLNCGVLLVSHNLHLVMAKTDTVVCINTHVCCTGTPSQVVNDGTFVQLFGPEVARSLVLYHHQHDHQHTIDGSIKSEENAQTAHSLE